MTTPPSHLTAHRPRTIRHLLTVILGTLLVLGVMALRTSEATAATPTVVRTALPSGSTSVSLAVGLDRVVGLDDRQGLGTGMIWSRQVSGAGFGPETVLTSSGSSVLVSGARTAVVSGSTTTLYDRGVAAGSIADATTQLTGPYLRGAHGIWKSDGKNLSAVTNSETTKYLFGHRLDELQLGPTGEIEVTLTDIDGSDFWGGYFVTTNGWHCSLGDLWGNHVVLQCPNNEILVTELAGSLPHGPYMYLAGTSPVPHGLGDGYLLLRDAAASSYSVWDLHTNAITSLPDCTTDPVTDGVGHIACTSAHDIVWMDYTALSTSAPSILGTAGGDWVDFAVTPTWSPEIDSEKALQAGTLEIVTLEYKVVRTLSTPASDDGSLRHVAWDGRDSAGALVAPGRYLYRLNAQAKDGTGAVAPQKTSAVAGQIVVLDPGWSKFIMASYQDFVGSQPSWRTMADASAQLSRYPRGGYLSGLANSNEWLNAIVTKMYNDTLGRDPDPDGLAGWVRIIRTHQMSVAEVASKFYVSDEYYLRSGGTPTTWVTALYNQILNRAPEPAGLAYWVDMTTKPGYGRHFVGLFFYQSTESRMTRVANLYQALLKRAPDPTGWPYWTNQVLSTGDITLAINLAESLEYWNQAQIRY